MSSKRLFLTSAILRECDKPEVGPNKVFFINRKKNEKLYTTGGGETSYRDVKVKVGTVTDDLVILYQSKMLNKNTRELPGASDDYITITNGVIDPDSITEDNKMEKRNPKEVTFASTISKSGELGRVLDIHDVTVNSIISAKSTLDQKDPEFIEIYRTVNHGGREVVNIIREINTGVKRTYSASQKVKEEYRGKPRVDPKIEFVGDFGVWPKTFIGSAGKPKMIVKDFDKSIPGTDQYEDATVDGNKLDETNAHLFISPNSRVYRIVLDKKSLSISNKYASNKIFVREILIQSTPPGVQEVVGDDGEVSVLSTEVSVLNLNSDNGNNTTTTNEPVAQPAEPVDTTPVADQEALAKFIGAFN
jgi:hypothetical protein